MKLRLLGTLMVATLLLSGCGRAHAQTAAPLQPTQTRAKARTAEIKQVTPQAALTLVTAPEAPVFLDVREADEFATGHAVGATLKPLSELAAWSKTLDKRAAYVVICRSGSRSMKACSALAAQGFTNLTNVQGGTLAWEADGLPLTK